MAQPPKDRDRKALIAALAEEARSRSTGTDGPEPEKLLDFLAGRLDPEEEERLSHYLLASPETSRALLDVADFEAAGAEAGKRPVELAAVAGWRDFERRLPGAAPSRFRRFQTLLPSIAAALLAATIGLSTWVWQLQRELSPPVANLQTIELKKDRGSTDAITLAPGAHLRLLLHPAVVCPVYTAEIEGPDRGDPIEVLPPDINGNLNLVLLRVETGTYSLRLSGCQRELENYRFRINTR